MTTRLPVRYIAALLCALAFGLLYAGAPARAEEEAGSSIVAPEPDRPAEPIAFLAQPRLQPVSLMASPIRFQLPAARPSSLETLANPSGLPTRIANSAFTASVRSGRHTLSLTAGLIDEKALPGLPPSLQGRMTEAPPTAMMPRQSLPPQSAFLTIRPPPFKNPVVNIDQRLYARPGYYLKLAWELPAPLAIDYLHFDNDADPRVANQNLEWSWRTQFDAVGVTADLSSSVQLRLQGLSGSTRMGHSMGGRLRVDTRFEAAYAQLSRQFERGDLSLRVEAFRTRNRGDAISPLNDENSWAATATTRHEVHPRITMLVEATHVRSARNDRFHLSPALGPPDNQLRFSLRARW